MIYHKGFKLVLYRDHFKIGNLFKHRHSWWAVIPFNEKGTLCWGPTKGACMRAIEQHRAKLYGTEANTAISRNPPLQDSDGLPPNTAP